MLVFAAVVFIGNVLFATDFIKWLGIRRLSFALLMSTVILICFYTVLFNFIGIFNLVTPWFIIPFEIILIFGYVFFRKNHLRVIIEEFRKLVSEHKLYFAVILPLLLLILLSAVLFPPNNQDSMTYHLARVVHWAQNKNIGYYFTSVDRQNRMGPGAEVLILLFQMLSFSDRLANLVQYSAFLFFCISLPDILRVIGINKRSVLFVAVFTISTPMLLLQASTTQNDILSAVLTWAIILVLLKVYRNKLSDIPNGIFILTGMLVAAAYLVKPTSVIVLLPMIAYIGIACIIKFKVSIKTYTVKIGLVLITVIILIAPDISRKFYHANERGVSFNDVFYPVAKEWNSSRFFNVFLAGMHHSPLAYPINEALIERAALFFKAKYDFRYIKTNWNFYTHEDYVGNPVHFIVFMILTLLGLVIFAIKGFKSRYLFFLLPLLSFLILGLFVRDNPWLSRIQLPFFLIVPMCFITLEAIRSVYFQQIYRIFFGILSFLCLGLGVLVVSQNAIRPLSMSTIFTPTHSLGDAANLYYSTNKELKPEHDKIISICKFNELTTVGVVAGQEFYEYPLLWQLYKNNIRMTHLDPKNVPDVDLIYFESAPQMEVGDQYLRVSERIYLKKKPITAFRDKQDLQFSLPSLIISDNGSARERSIFFYGNGQISTRPISFPKGKYVLSVQSNGAEVAGHGSHWNVSIGSRKIGDLNSTGTGQLDSLYFEILQNETCDLKMDFDNDIYDPALGLDRNGEISKISIHKVEKHRSILAVENELDLSLSELVTYDNGVRKQNGIFFYGNGRIHFQPVFFKKGRYLLKIRSNGMEVAGQGSHWNVIVGDRKMGDINSIKTGQTDSISFEISVEGDHQIQMNFDNDMFDAARGWDRNAEIEKVTILRIK